MSVDGGLDKRENLLDLGLWPLVDTHWLMTPHSCAYKQHKWDLRDEKQNVELGCVCWSGFRKEMGVHMFITHCYMYEIIKQ